MRTRQHISDDFNKRNKGRVGLGVLEQQLEMQAIVLEVLLDIRDLLQQPQPPTIIPIGGDAHDRDEGLHSEDNQHP